MARAKYGKLLFEIEEVEEGVYEVKSEYIKPLLEFAKSKSYKDIVMKKNDVYYNCDGFEFTLLETFIYFTLTFDDGSSVCYVITINTSTDEIVISVANL